MTREYLVSFPNAPLGAEPVSCATLPEAIATAKGGRGKTRIIAVEGGIERGLNAGEQSDFEEILRAERLNLLGQAE